MKQLTIDELERIANTHYGEIQFNEANNLLLDFGGFGFEATDFSGNLYWGFRYYGPNFRMKSLTKVWSELTEPQVLKPMLTIDAAMSLMSKRVRLSYSDVNEGEFIITITGIKQEYCNLIGQNVQQILLFTEDGSKKIQDWIYEWQGIFRRGSGAERLFIEEVYE